MPGDDYRPDVRLDGVSTLRHYLQALWRRKWVALAPLVVIPLITLVASLRQEALYEASADVLVNRQEVATTTLIGQTPALDNADRTMATQARLARVSLVAERTLAAAGSAGSSTNVLLDRSSVVPLADILRFTVSDEGQGRAARLASEYARQFVRYGRELDTAGLARTLEELSGRIKRLEAAGDVDSPLYLRLADREGQLELLKALRVSNVSVVQTPGAGDAEQVAPRPRRNTALALAAGLFVGLILVFLWESLSTRPRSEEEFESLLDMPLLARLRLGSPDNVSVGRSSIDSAADAIHTLRTSLELTNAAVGARTIMITTPRAGEGKTATTVQLGIALARAGRHVALVDLDLRQSALTRLVGIDNELGVTTVARGQCELAEALAALPLGDGDEQGAPIGLNGRPGLRALLEVVGSGPLTVHPAEFLSSNALGAVLDELQRRADIVLVEVPPLLDAPDAAAVAARVDGILLVVSARHARGPALANVRRAIDSWPAARLGFALTDGGDERPYVGQLRRATRSTRAPVVEPEQVA